MEKERLKNTDDLNISTLASILVAEAKMNKTGVSMAFSVYAGRNGRDEESAVGMLTQLIPVFARVDEDTTAGSLTDSLKKQISLGLSYPEYSFIYDRFGSAVDMVRYIFQRDIYKPTRLFLLEEGELPIVNKQEGSAGLLSISVVANTGCEEAILGIRYSKDNYDAATIEDFAARIMQNHCQMISR